MYSESTEEMDNEGSFEPEIQLKLSLGLKPEDADEILELATNCQCLTQDKMSMLEQSVWEEAYNDDEPYSVFIKARAVNGDEEPLAGFACYGGIPGEEGCFELYLLAVDEEFREIGIGSAVIDEVSRQVAAAGGDTIFCEVSENRNHDAARNFFESLGYVRQTRHYRFFIPEKGNAVYARKIS
ncbi:N-acetyltransferase [Maridesulfovibrio sp.]|uniref:GNAT family N-acetyltransferase n=1 Tax=Maridesulfovibrio sp. TaxID=2795000 RepID=UPI002A18D2AD|nr:N-acetyltransferase [Maridesulfovibrio sp.]